MASSFVRNITIDCRNAYELAAWWSLVTGGTLAADDSPGDPEASVLPPSGTSAPRLLFEQVPEPKAVKNRIHLDLEPDTSRDEEVARLHSLGAGFVADFRRPNGTGWVVLSDPEGNEFCVERSQSERHA